MRKTTRHPCRRRLRAGRAGRRLCPAGRSGRWSAAPRRARCIRPGARCSGRSPWTSGARARRSAARPSDCGTEVTVYVRAKIGFCNCTTGVSDDEELDRISDYDLLGNKLAALGPGRPIAVAWMKGRSRAFTRRRRTAGSASRRCRSASTTAAMPSSRPRCWDTSNRPRSSRRCWSFSTARPCCTGPRSRSGFDPVSGAARFNAAYQSTWILADLATAAHLSTSALMKAWPCAGVSENCSLPSFLRPAW